MLDKPLVWLDGKVQSPPFSRLARRQAGWLLGRLQKGETLSMPRSRPMPGIGPRCHELRIDDRATAKAWRIIYRVDPDAIARATGRLRLYDEHAKEAPQ